MSSQALRDCASHQAVSTHPPSGLKATLSTNPFWNDLDRAHSIILSSSASRKSTPCMDSFGIREEIVRLEEERKALWAQYHEVPKADNPIWGDPGKMSETAALSKKLNVLVEQMQAIVNRLDQLAKELGEMENEKT